MISKNTFNQESEYDFNNCKLDRRQYADSLTGIVELYKRGFVLAINNKWGEGKTTFVRMWENDLKQKSFTTIRFNAWENDFEDSPMVALMGELKTLVKGDTNDKKFDNLVKAATSIVKESVPVILKSFINKHLGESAYKDILEANADKVMDWFAEGVQEYDNRKKNIIEFKKRLKEFTSTHALENKPIVFIIDELDRCRPDYAVSVLEQIKHFFSIPDIVFVLSIDKEQLGHAIRGVYGSDLINADEYLRRFIDVEFSLPKANSGEYYNYLINKYDISEIIKEKTGDSLGFDTIPKKICMYFFKKTQLSIRDQEKLFIQYSLSLKFSNVCFNLSVEINLILLLIKFSDDTLYNIIRLKSIPYIEFYYKLEDFFYQISFDEDRSQIYKMEILLAFLYATDHNENLSYQEAFTNNTNKGYELKGIRENTERLKQEEIDKSEYIRNKNIIENVINILDFADNRFDLDFFVRQIEILDRFKV